MVLQCGNQLFVSLTRQIFEILCLNSQVQRASEDLQGWIFQRRFNSQLQIVDVRLHYSAELLNSLITLLDCTLHMHGAPGARGGCLRHRDFNSTDPTQRCHPARLCKFLMFSYREFSEGARAYRNDALKSADPQGDQEYEAKRALSELAVINLSRTTDPRDLLSIYTHLLRLLGETRRYSRVLEYENCVKLSAAFTYSKLISQQFELAFSEIDAIYTELQLSYGLSGGGLIYRLAPTGREWKGIAAARAKVPITEAVGKTRVILHEAFVAMVALNPLRRLIPSFSYVYAYWQCGNFITGPRGAACKTAGLRPIMIYESIPDGTRSLFSHVFTHGKMPDLVTILHWLLQLMGALEMAHQYADYTHYDLHSGNVLIQEGDVQIDFLDYSIQSAQRITIIDNGLAHCGYDNPIIGRKKAAHPNGGSLEIFLPTDRSSATSIQAFENLSSSRILHYGSTMNQAIGVHRDRSYPLGDVFRIFFDIYSMMTPALRRELQPLVSHFFIDANMGNRLRGLTRQSSLAFNDFSLPPFREDLFSYRYRDFSEVIMANYAEQLGSTVILRSVPRGPMMRVRGVRLSDVFDWERLDQNFRSSFNEIGVCAMIDYPRTTRLLEVGARRKTETDEALQQLVGWFNSVEKLLSEITFKIQRRRGRITLDDILLPQFYREYYRSVWWLVSLVIAIRELFTRILLTTLGIKIAGWLDDRPAIELVADTLGIRADDIGSLGALSRRLPLTKRVKSSLEKLREVSEDIYDVVRQTESPKPMPANWQPFSWYRACLPSVFDHLNFCDQWGDEESIFPVASMPEQVY